MARTFQKVHKHVSKKKGAVEALHENSRDANRIRRAAARDDRVARVNATMSRGRDLYSMTVSLPGIYILSANTAICSPAHRLLPGEYDRFGAVLRR